MNTLFTILTILIVIAAILLVAVVLLQSGKGEGMASNFTSANQTLGVRQTADILEKVNQPEKAAEYRTKAEEL